MCCFLLAPADANGHRRAAYVPYEPHDAAHQHVRTDDDDCYNLGVDRSSTPGISCPVTTPNCQTREQTRDVSSDETSEGNCRMLVAY